MEGGTARPRRLARLSPGNHSAMPLCQDRLDESLKRLARESQRPVRELASAVSSGDELPGC